ncbi:MAG: DNA translocase FtsK, partial [Deltaproteobacteria bacterium]
HLRIGYNRAATLIEQLEKEGIIGPSTGASKRRQVLVGHL